MQDNKTKYTLDAPFVPIFRELLQAGSLSTIVDSDDYNTEVVVKWDLYTATIYSFILNQYNYHNITTISYDFISANCCCSIDVVKRRVKVLEGIGVITIKRSKTLAGTWGCNTYTNVIDILKSNKFKLGKSDYYKRYRKKLAIRKERMLLLKGIIVDKSWTKEEAYNFYRNTNYELMTGEYLTGDKLSKPLYLKVKTTEHRTKSQEDSTNLNGSVYPSNTNGYSASDELKLYELEQLYKE